MPTVTGKVIEVHVSVDYGYARIEKDDGLVEKVIVWSDLYADYLPPQRIQHGIWLAMLRDALAHGYTVDATCPDDIEPMQALSIRL